MKESSKVLIPLGVNKDGLMTFVAVKRDVLDGITNPAKVSFPGADGYGVDNLVAELEKRLGLKVTADELVKVGAPVVNHDSVDGKGNAYSEASQFYRLNRVLESFSVDLNAIGFGGVLKASRVALEFHRDRDLLSPPIAAALEQLPDNVWTD